MSEIFEDGCCFTLQILSVLITYFLLIVQFANPTAKSADSNATNATL